MSPSKQDEHITARRVPDALKRLRSALGALIGRLVPHHPPVRALRRNYEVPQPPEVAPAPNVLRFFTPHEAQTVEALASLILPATGEGPGAREAGALSYIDYLLSQDDGFAQPIYRKPPFARTYEGESPPPQAPGAEPVIWMKKAELARYGLQSSLTPQEAYRRGLAALDRWSYDHFHADFVDLEPAAQDKIVAALATDQADGFDEPGARAFFEMVAEHTVEGTFSDPQYGGNRDKIAWKAIGFAGAQRAYSADDLKTEALDLAPQSLAEMHHMAARMPHDSDVHSTLAMPMPLAPARQPARESKR
jgi:gluconate 2-dehydrogenase gamma chain